MTSKLKTDILETVSGSGTIALTNQLSGMTDASMPSGSVVQVKNFALTATFVMTTASTWTDTTLVLSITPSSTASKILITYSVSYAGQNGQRGGTRIIRGSTPLCIANASSNRIQTTSSFQGTSTRSSDANLSATYLDSPSTASAVTYKVQAFCENTSPVYFNRGFTDEDNNTLMRATSQITLMEIKG
tara:strand:+ start:499 stop:1062 length:564 start_codon:yes stop_codon:yes gene_type:complete